MIKGSYTIYKNGEEVSSQDNVITNFGKDTIWKYLCGSVPDWGGAIAVGAGTASAVASDTRLDFEFARNLTLLKSPSLNGSSRVITLKTSLEPNVAGIIKEVGVYNTLGPTNPSTFDGRIITQFAEGVNESGETSPEKWSYSSSITDDSTNSRIGTKNIILNGTSSTAYSYLGGTDEYATGYLSIDLTKYSPLDSFEIAYKLMTAISAGGKSIKVKLLDDQLTPASIYKIWNFDSSVAIGEYSNTATFSEFTPETGTFNYNISMIKIETDAHVSFDAIRIDDTDSVDTTYGLVSRAVLGTPITKLAGDSIDIEYKLTLEL